MIGPLPATRDVSKRDSTRRQLRTIAVGYRDARIVHFAEPGHVLDVGERLVFRRIFGTGAGRQTLHQMLRPAVEEERDGETFRAGPVEHAVRRRQKAIVCPAPQHIAAVDEEGAWNGRRVDPPSAGQSYGKSRDLVGRQQSHEARIGVRRQTELVVGHRILRRIMRHAQFEHRI